MTLVTFIDIDASSRNVGRIIRESLIAHACWLQVLVHLAVGVGGAFDAVTWRLAAGEWIPDESLVTLTGVTTLRVGALAVDSTGGLVQTFVDVPALGGEGSWFNLFKSGSAFTLISSHSVVTLGIRSANILGLALVHVCLINWNQDCVIVILDVSPFIVAPGCNR